MNSELIRLLANRIVGVGFGIAVGVGGTIGSGILRTAGEVAAQLRSSWLVVAVWLLGGVYAFFCTASVTELATMLPSPSPRQRVYEHL
jgi:basic amino acid/polyamine antiporter, APA family